MCEKIIRKKLDGKARIWDDIYSDNLISVLPESQSNCATSGLQGGESEEEAGGGPAGWVSVCRK